LTSIGEHRNVDGPMAASQNKPYVAVLVTLLGGAAGLILSSDVRVADQPPVRYDLPDRVGIWTGDELLFCINPDAPRDAPQRFLVSELGDSRTCPDCGELLSTAASGELAQLPEDTILRKKQYTHPSGQIVSAAIVVGGHHRASIHRPQVCLTGDGGEIINSRVVQVPFATKGLDVMVLDLTYPVRGPSGRIGQYPSYYAYWFVGNRHETPHHVERMIWMAADKILSNTAHRWAYVSVSGVRDPVNQGHLELVQSFLQEFYPLIRIDDA